MYAKVAAPTKIQSSRAANDLNDQLVTINAGTTGTATHGGRGNIVGGHGNIGTVWAVQAGQALVHFAEEIESKSYGRITKEIRTITTVIVPADALTLAK